MENFNLVKDQLNFYLENSQISGRILLDQLRVIDQYTRKSSAYSDHKYFPFYYHLGKLINPTSFIELGHNLAFTSCCLLKSCKTIKNFLAFQKKTNDTYFPNLAEANIRDNYKESYKLYVGNIEDDKFHQLFSPNSWDLIIINEELNYDILLTYMEIMWQYLSLDGLLVVDNLTSKKPMGEAFNAFSESKSKIPFKFKTKYGTGLIQK